MAVWKRHLTKDYTVMSNHHLRNKNLSLKAKGLLSIMLSLPDDWDYSIKGLASISKEKEDAIETGLKELKKEGYLVIEKVLPNVTESGRIEYTYNIYEYPQSDKKQEGEKQGVEFQGVEFQGTENPPQLNTKESITKELNTKDIKENIKRKNFEEIEALFESFWKAYPRHVGKKKAKATWMRCCKDKDTYNLIMKALTKQIVANKWDKDDKYCPHPTTWLNQERWNDEVEVKHGANKKSSTDYGIKVL